MATVTLPRNDDPLMCPVKACARIYARVAKYPGVSKDTSINAYMIGQKFYYFSSNDMINTLRKAVRMIGEPALGFKSSEVGTHSLRSGGAMALCLAGIEEYRIKIIGRWKSDGFMKYIRKQIKQFTEGVSARMIENESFFQLASDVNCI